MAEVVVNVDVIDTDPPGADALEELVKDWKAEVVRLNPQLHDLLITVDLDEFGGPAVGHWHFYFELGQEYFEAIANGELQTFAFTDNAGYFEDHVPRADVSQRIVDLFAGLQE